MVVCFLFAHVLKNLNGGFSSIAKVSIYIPTVISGVVAAVIFIFILDYRAGILNEALKLFGMQKVAFLTDKTLSTLAIIIPSIWLGFGSNTLILYAGLLNIPKEYYEAAQVDGANAFVQLIKITIPSLKNIFVLNAIGLVTGTIQMFDLPFIMTGGGPLNRTLTPMIFLFNKFRDANVTMGFTLAGALLMMIVIGVVNSFVFNIITSEKSQDA
jgi:ABC-type sugar transport system permease subunit